MIFYTQMGLGKYIIHTFRVLDFKIYNLRPFMVENRGTNKGLKIKFFRPQFFWSLYYNWVVVQFHLLHPLVAQNQHLAVWCHNLQFDKVICFLWLYFLTKHAPATGWHVPGFLKSFLCRHLYVCLTVCVCAYVCVRPRGY